MAVAIVAGRRIAPYQTGSGYPDASNMPSVSGSILTYYPNYPTNVTPSTSTLTLNTPGGGALFTSATNQIIQDLDIAGAVVVQHGGVIIRRCRVRAWDFYGILSDSGAFTGTPLLVEDCVITSPNNGLGDTGIANSNFEVRRCSISAVENGFDVFHDVNIHDCYIHDLFTGPGSPHTDGVQTSSGASTAIANVTVRHCTILSRGFDGTTYSDGNSCIFNALGSTSFTDCTYDDNVMAGGSFCLYGPQSTTGTRVAITSNKFATFFDVQAGTFGPWADATDEATVTGNQLGTFSGGLSGPAGGTISGTWSGSPLP
jgi:hypothetical protein